jgi:hypothetical protein
MDAAEMDAIHVKQILGSHPDALKVHIGSTRTAFLVDAVFPVAFQNTGV